MATVTFVEKDGQRIDITGLEPKQELRCDACGEYLGQGDAVVISVNVWHLAERVSAHTADAHPDHIADAIMHAAERATAQLPS